MSEKVSPKEPRRFKVPPKVYFERDSLRYLGETDGIRRVSIADPLAFHVSHGRTNALLLPHVIRHNGTATGKATPWPKAEVYRAPERFQEIARMLGLPAASPEQGVESYACAVEEFRARCGIPASFADAGVDEAAFIEALPEQAMNAYADQCAPANPRMPMIDEMRQLMRQAYYGNGAGA